LYVTKFQVATNGINTALIEATDLQIVREKNGFLRENRKCRRMTSLYENLKPPNRRGW